MKKAAKILSLLLVFAICFSLSGCGVLEEMRQTRAIMEEDGTIKFYDGTTYLPLPACEGLIPVYNEFELVYLVEEELPLLLTFFSGDTFQRSDNGVFLSFYGGDTEILYCRSDVYDTVLDSLENGITGETYVYWYINYEEGTYDLYTLTDDQADAIGQVCSTQTPEVLPEMAVLDYDYLIDMMICPEDQLFMMDTVDLCVLNDKYYVVIFGEEATVLYSVPESLSDTFEDIFEHYIESENYWLDNW